MNEPKTIKWILMTLGAVVLVSAVVLFVAGFSARFIFLLFGYFLLFLLPVLFFAFLAVARSRRRDNFLVKLGKWIGYIGILIVPSGFVLSMLVCWARNSCNNLTWAGMDAMIILGAYFGLVLGAVVLGIGLFWRGK